MNATAIIVVGSNYVGVDRHPDKCPLCHKSVVPAFKAAEKIADQRITVQAVFQCPNGSCNELFIATYLADRDGGLELSDCNPKNLIAPELPDSMKEISKSFCEIYTEANKAEQLGLLQACGPAYRKSLEFLIKDYLISLQPQEASNIRKSFLGECISSFVTDHRIKQIATRAVWLGNDEVHYERRWVDKDLNDLKALIRLTMHWIEQERLTGEILSSMPRGR